MAVISVFGSAAPGPGTEAYQLAYELGRVLASAGYSVQTGGYSGVMEAASRGAHEAGGHVIGVTAVQVEQVRAIPLNPWVKEERKFDTLRTRLLYLVEQCAGAVVLPGGVGTLAELALSWNLMQMNEMDPKPLLALGAMWANTLNAFILPEYVSSQHRELVQIVDTPQAALVALQAALTDPNT